MGLDKIWHTQGDTQGRRLSERAGAVPQESPEGGEEGEGLHVFKGSKYSEKPEPCQDLEAGMVTKGVSH